MRRAPSKRMEKKRKPRSDIGKPTPGRGNKSARGVAGHNGKNAGRKKGKTLLIKVFALPEDDAIFIQGEQAERGHDDPRQTIKQLVKEKRMEKTQQAHKAAEDFAGEAVECVGSQTGTTYTHGESDQDIYFEPISGKHIVVAVSGQDGSMSSAKSDGIVW